MSATSLNWQKLQTESQNVKIYRPIRHQYGTKISQAKCKQFPSVQLVTFFAHENFDMYR